MLLGAHVKIIGLSVCELCQNTLEPTKTNFRWTKLTYNKEMNLKKEKLPLVKEVSCPPVAENLFIPRETLYF